MFELGRKIMISGRKGALGSWYDVGLVCDSANAQQIFPIRGRGVLVPYQKLLRHKLDVLHGIYASCKNPSLTALDWRN